MGICYIAFNVPNTDLDDIYGNVFACIGCIHTLAI